MEQVLNNLILLMSNGLATYVLYRFMYVFFDARQVRKEVAVAVYLLQFCISSFVMVKVSYPVINIGIALLCYGMLTACYAGNIGKKISVTILIYIIGLIIEVFVAFCMQITNISLLDRLDVNILGTLMVYLLEWLLTILLEKCVKPTNKNKNIPGAFVVAICIALLTEVFMGCLILLQKNLSNIQALLFFVCLFLICFLMLYLYQALSAVFIERDQRELIRQERNFYHTQAEMLQENSEQIRKFHHDYKNKMLVLQGLLEQEDLEKAKEYLLEVTQKIEYVKAYSRTGNVILDSVINYKLSKAQEQGIDVTAEIKLPDRIQMEDDDMVVIMGNLLDNAIEATNKLTQNRKIELDLAEIKGMLCIKVQNTFDGKVKISKGKFRTRKEDSVNHGIGLDSVESIVEKYQGEMKVSYEDKIFITALYLYQTNRKTEEKDSRNTTKL